MTTENGTASTETPKTPTATAAPASIPDIPSPELVASWAEYLDGIIAALGSAATPLTTQQRSRSLKLPKGGEPLVGLMASLGAQYNVQLPGVDPKLMEASLLLVQRLQPLDTKLRAIGGVISDSVSSAKTESWQGTTALYTALTRASARSASLQKELKPAVEFFARKNRGKKGKKKETTGNGGREAKEG